MLLHGLLLHLAAAAVLAPPAAAAVDVSLVSPQLFRAAPFPRLQLRVLCGFFSSVFDASHPVGRLSSSASQLASIPASRFPSASQLASQLAN